MQSADESGSSPPNGESRHVLLTTVDLAQHVSDISSRLKTLTERFEAHAEQEEDRSKRTSEKLDTLAKELHRLGTLPALALPNLLAQGSEGQGPTGTSALLTTVASGVIWLLWPKLQAWLAKGTKT